MPTTETAGARLDEIVDAEVLISLEEAIAFPTRSLRGRRLVSLQAVTPGTEATRPVG